MKGSTKAVLWIMAVVLCISVGVYFSGCAAKDDGTDGGSGGGGGGGSGSGMCSAFTDCAAYCQKELLCDSTVKVTDCTTSCQAAVPNMQDSFVTAVTKCVDDCTSYDTCETAASAGCATGNADVVIAAMCAKEVECNAGLTQDACVAEAKAQSGIEMLNCLCAGGVDLVKSCITNASCTDQSSISNCLEQATGGGSSSSADAGT